MKPRRRLSLISLMVFAAAGFVGPRIPAQKKEQSANSWPDATEINRMFGDGRETPVQKHIRTAFAAKKAGDGCTAVREWTEVLRLHPESEYAGAYFYRAQAYEEMEQLEKAVADLDTFLKHYPKSAPGLSARGIIHADRDEFEQALRDCNRALEIDPKYAFGYALRADVYRLHDQYDKAFQDAARALALNPKVPRAYQVRGRIYEEKKDYHRAAEAFTQAMRCDPSWPNPVIARADAYKALGNERAALADFRRAVALAPGLPRPHNAVAWTLATSPEKKWRDGKTAMKEATIACSLTEWKNPSHLDTLAAACAEAGDFLEAVRRSEEALKLGSREKKAIYAAHLASFRAGKPWREPDPAE